MRNKRRGELFLDFTSLLDVTLIILFFFIMYSSFQSESKTHEALDSAAELTALAEEKMRAAEELSARADSRAEEMRERLDELERIAAENDNFKGVSDFASGQNYKMIYTAENGEWSFEVRRGDSTVTVIDRVNHTPESLTRALGDTDRGSYIFCECIFVSPEYIDSRNVLDTMIKKAQESFPHLLISKTYL